MAYKPQVNYNPKLSLDDNFKAALHWLNFLLREMSVGRVPQTQKETLSLQQHQTQQDEALIELYEIMEGV